MNKDCHRVPKQKYKGSTVMNPEDKIALEALDQTRLVGNSLDKQIVGGPV